jgi:hypothetical protein
MSKRKRVSNDLYNYYQKKQKIDTSRPLHGNNYPKFSVSEGDIIKYMLLKDLLHQRDVALYIFEILSFLDNVNVWVVCSIVEDHIGEYDIACNSKKKYYSYRVNKNMTLHNLMMNQKDTCLPDYMKIYSTTTKFYNIKIKSFCCHEQLSFITLVENCILSINLSNTSYENILYNEASHKPIRLFKSDFKKRRSSITLNGRQSLILGKSIDYDSEEDLDIILYVEFSTTKNL